MSNSRGIATKTIVIIIFCIVIVGLGGYFGWLFYQQKQKIKEEVKVPEMSYYGMKCINCRENPDYPFQTDEKLTEIKGMVTLKPVGSKTCLGYVFAVDNQFLFDPKTRTQIINFEKLSGETIIVRGYLAQTGRAKTSCLQLSGEYKSGTITLHNVFYVNEIISWRNVCCDTLDDAGNIKERNFCFWVKK